MGNVYLIGMGPGNEQYWTKQAKEAIKACFYLTGSSRLLDEAGRLIPKGAETHVLRSLKECLKWIDEKQGSNDVGVLISGDVHYYSLAGTIERSDYQWNTIYVPGISSYQMMAAKIGITLEDAALLSVHGRNESNGYVAYQVCTNQKAFFLCSGDFAPEQIAKALCSFGMQDVVMYIGSRLSSDKEQIVKVKASEAENNAYPGFSVVYVENRTAQKISGVNYLKDEQFIRGKVPMTKEEIRILIMHRLNVEPYDCLWDLGAGTGSVSIEMARHTPFGRVYSVEYKERALDLIEKNKQHFACTNLTIVSGRIKDSIYKLPEPNKVFLGGNEGELCEVIDYLKKLPKQVHVVMTAVTMETLAEAVRQLSGERNFSYMQVQIGQSKMVGSYHTTDMNHPIWILEVDL
ncbi:MAG: precorrin-6y C5,15-methyltransferase (decarboxylating) subunit CbiE [Lachnospiraceae bacterium]|nr:precorrin-6y C5,15-methyltransferase (decarboxylating) subunit CbiE [Lachnospiraceae bacterium]